MIEQMTREQAAGRIQRMLRDPNDHWSGTARQALSLAIAALREEREPCNHMHNIEVLQKDDGVWLSFKTSKGQCALINWTAFCCERGPVIGDACLQWAEDQLACEKKREPCKKCAEWEKAWDKLVENIWFEHFGALPWANNLPFEKPYCKPGAVAIAIQKWARSLDPRRMPTPPPEPDPLDLWKRSIKGWRL